MGPVDRLRSKLKARHLKFLAAVLLFAIGIYNQMAGNFDGENPGVVDFIWAVGTLAGFAYIVYYGFRVSPWDELKRLFWGSLLSVILVLFSLGMVSVAAGLSDDPRSFFLMLPAGLEMYSLLISVFAAATFLAPSAILRFVYRNITGAGGDQGSGGVTPEEKVLSAEEWEEFDHPTKRLRQILAFLVSPITGPNRTFESR